MSRLEKAREEKRKSKKKTGRLLFLMILLIVIAPVFFYFYYMDELGGQLEENELLYLDLEKTAAAVDMFELTYVRVYIFNGLEVDEIRVDGRPLDKSDTGNRWERTLTDSPAGSRLNIVVVVDGLVAQEEEIIVENL